MQKNESEPFRSEDVKVLQQREKIFNIDRLVSLQDHAKYAFDLNEMGNRCVG
jgi:hypothetical protein